MMKNKTYSLYHALRWRAVSSSRRGEWTDRKLALGDHYWLFILGCTNSGTTLLRKILDHSPLIRTLPQEGQYLTRALPNATRMGVGRVFSRRLDVFRLTENSPGEPAARVQYDWAAWYPPGPGILLEKSPPNTLRSRWLQRHFKPARFLVLTRLPHAVCEGMQRRRGHSIEEAAVHWKRVHEILLEDMQHLDMCLTIRYEDLCDHPGKELTRIEDFLGIRLGGQSIPAKSGSSPVRDELEIPLPIRNLNAESLKRLDPDSLDTVNRIAGAVMGSFGYRPVRT
jgi:hypothetical protein